jgi:beta-glucuronidase
MIGGPAPRIEVAIEAQGLSRIVIEVRQGGSVWQGQSEQVGPGVFATSIALPGCALWSHTAPALIDVQLFGEDAFGARVDEVALRSGVREVRVDGNRLLLNGKPISLKGFGKHEDSPVRGRGLDLPQLVKDMQLLKWCGANSVRTSHYPYAEEFYDLCDEQGVLVIDEAFSINLDFRKVAAEGLAAHKADIAAMIRRDYNHPCVIAWSLANEPGYLGEAVYAEASRPYWRELFGHARSLDAHRPLTHANVSYAGLDDPAFDCSDFLMINRYYGWYQAPAQLDRAVAMLIADFDHLAAAHGKPIFVSEFGADALAGAHSTTPQLFTEDFQADFIEAYWRAIVAHPAVIGGHVWNFADFRTAQHSRRAVFNLKGVFTRDRTPKKAAYRVRELWTEKNDK